MPSVDFIVDELAARYHRARHDGVAHRKIYEEWSTHPKPAPMDVFTAAVHARAELDKIKPRVDATDMANWATRTSLTEAELLDAVAEKIAKDFLGKVRDFEFCDWLINCIGKPEYRVKQCAFFWDVWLAFDAGESRTGPENPIEKYTKPQLQKLLETRP